MTWIRIMLLLLAGYYSWADCRCGKGFESITHGQGDIQSEDKKPCTWVFNTRPNQMLRLSVTSKRLDYDDCFIRTCIKCAGSLTVGGEEVSCTSRDMPCFTSRSSASCPADPKCKELTTSEIRVTLSPDNREWYWEDNRFSMNYKYTDCPKGSHTTQKPTTLRTSSPWSTTKQLPVNQLNTTQAETFTHGNTTSPTTALVHRTAETSAVSWTAQGAPRNCSDVKNCSTAKDSGKTVIIIAVVVCLLILALLVVLGIAMYRRRNGPKKLVLDDNNSNPHGKGSSQSDQYAEVEEIGVRAASNNLGAINPSYEDIYTAADEVPSNISRDAPSTSPSGRNQSVVSIYSTVGRSSEPERSGKAKVTIRYKKLSEGKEISVPEKTTGMVDNVLYGLTTENEDENYYAIDVGEKANRSTNGEMVTNVLYTSLE